MKTTKLFRLVFLLIAITSNVMTLKAQMVGITRNDFLKHYRAQKESMWCWASSAEMVLSYEGILLPQEAIVRYLKGYIVNNPGSQIDMIKSTNCIVNDSLGNAIVISGQYVSGAPYPNVLFNQLKSKRPVILTFNANPFVGHAIVLTGIDYVVNPDNTLSVTKCYIFDPFSYIQSLDIVGRPYFKEDVSLRYKEYNMQMNQWDGVMLLSGNNVVGTVTGVILIAASHL
jgi:hypothetical protein